MDRSVEDVLVAARDLLEEHGVALGRFKVGKAYCSRGAILAACGVPFLGYADRAGEEIGSPVEQTDLITDTLAWRARKTLERALNLPFMISVSPLADWNNKLVGQGRSDEVIEGFNKVIDSLREKSEERELVPA